MTLIVNENKFLKRPRISSDNIFGEEKSVWNVVSPNLGISESHWTSHPSISLFALLMRLIPFEIIRLLERVVKILRF